MSRFGQSSGGCMLLVLLALAGGTAVSPDPPVPPPSNENNILEHWGSSHTIELPYWKAPYYVVKALPQLPPIHVAGVTVDLSPTRHAVFLTLAAVLVALVFLYTSRRVAQAQAQGRPPRGFAAAMEAMVLYIRQEVILPNVGAHGEGYVNYLLTVFFFVLTCNLLGLMPWVVTRTSNFAVTRASDLLSLVVIDVAGVRVV